MQDLKYMEIALKQANEAFLLDEVPVGAVLVYQDKVIAKAHNTNHMDQNTLSHAEIKVINQGCQLLKSKYLDECSLYVTLEPCLMCTGAILNARIKKVYFATFDLNNGAFISSNQINGIEWYAGLLKEESSTLLKKYFNLKRKEK